MEATYLYIPITATEANRGVIRNFALGDKLGNIKFPANIEPGKRIRLAAAAPLIHPTLHGDVFLIIREIVSTPQPMTMGISLTREEARAGCIKVLNLNKRLTVTIPKGIDEGNTIRLSRGAQFVTPGLLGDLHLKPEFEPEVRSFFAYRWRSLSQYGPDDFQVSFSIPFLISFGFTWKMRRTQAKVTW